MSEPPGIVRIELTPGDQPMCGRVHVGRRVESFDGWLDLLRVLTDALEPQPPGDRSRDDGPS